jgi:FKBP-type peptidyl-prolyl cis-trans isomerase 2
MCESREECAEVEKGAAAQRDDCSCSGCCPTACKIAASKPRVVAYGDIVTIDITLRPENGLVIEPLFDRNGTISFVVGWGNYLPALHQLVQGKAVGDKVRNVSIDAGWGDRNPDLVMELPKAKLKRFLNDDGSVPAVGSILDLQDGVQLVIMDINEEQETATVDANPPLAGASYDCSFRVLKVENLPQDASPESADAALKPRASACSRYEVATVALGCFWGGK